MRPHDVLPERWRWRFVRHEAGRSKSIRSRLFGFWRINPDGLGSEGTVVVQGSYLTAGRIQN